MLLVSVEPHFNVWSAADRLYDKDTTHWTGTAQPLTILLEADGTTYRLCGRGSWNEQILPVLSQTECRVGETVTHYRFEDRNGLSAEIDFTTPRLTDGLDVFSRPVTYVTVRVKGARKHAVRASITKAWATNDNKAEMVWTTNTIAGIRDISVGRREQTPFSICGDHKRADWGRVHLVGPLTYAASTNWPYAYAPHDLGLFPIAEGQYYGMKKG